MIRFLITSTNRYFLLVVSIVLSSGQIISQIHPVCLFAGRPLILSVLRLDKIFTCILTIIPKEYVAEERRVVIQGCSLKAFNIYLKHSLYPRLPIVLLLKFYIVEAAN